MNEAKFDLTKGARRTSETEIFPLLEWAKDYERDNNFPRTPFERFAVGFYQTSQAERHLREFLKHGNESALTQAWEAWAACSLHLMMVSEQISTVDEDGGIWGCHVNLDREFKKCLDKGELLFRWGRAQQIVLYWWVVNKNKEKKYDRKSRINIVQLSEDLWFLIHHYRACVPKDSLSKSIYQATDIMCGKL